MAAVAETVVAEAGEHEGVHTVGPIDLVADKFVANPFEMLLLLLHILCPHLMV